MFFTEWEFIQSYPTVFENEQGSLMVTYISANLTSWHEAPLLSLIDAFDEAHELSHHVAVVVGRPEGVVCNCPARRKDHKICGGSTCTVVGSKSCTPIRTAAPQAIGRV